MNVLINCKYEEDPIKNEGARVFTTFSPLYFYGSYRLRWTPEFWSDLVQNLMHPFPLPDVASDKIWLRLAYWLRRYSSLKMFTDRQTDTHLARQTTDRLVYYKLTICSGKLKMKWKYILDTVTAKTQIAWPSLLLNTFLTGVFLCQIHTEIINSIHSWFGDFKIGGVI